ncbi:hypothetical protein evm_012259 [Chilo suppressalis]|nr:hypothetical protein evm_012259 [Chilo suppressalis]
MTMRLSALFESLWARSRSTPVAKSRQRRQRVLNGRVGGDRRAPLSVPAAGGAGGGSDSSDSETLAVASRRQRAARGGRGGRRGGRDSWDSDAPLRTHTKGKGVGKKSKSSATSIEPAPGPSRAPHESSNGPRGRVVSSRRPPYSSSGSDDSVPGHDDHMPTNKGVSNRRRRVSGSESGSGSWRAPRHKKPRTHAAPQRSRERFTSVSSSSSSASNESLAPLERRRYSSDRSYRPRYSTDDDAPLNLYRQRQGGASEEGTSTGRAPRRKLNGHAAGVSLRARRSPRRYNEQSDSDSAAAISKRSQHRRARDHDADQRHHARRRRHAQNMAVNEDHNYFNGHAPSGAGAGAPPSVSVSGASGHGHGHGAGRPVRPARNGDTGSGSGGNDTPAVSISSRGRVRKLTAKARGLFRD